jgi:exosortase/archaeosortase family protein
MRIITDCTAIHYLLIISSAMLASYWHPLAYRLMGIIFVIPLLLVANAFRLLITGLAGAVSPQLFSFVHEYLWVTIFILLTWGLWIAWERGIHPGSLKRQIPVLFLSCTLLHVILTILSTAVGTLITGLANILLAPFNFKEAIRFQWEGGRVLSVIGSETITLSLNGEILLLAVYSGIVVTGILLKEKVKILRAAACWVMLFTLCALVVAINAMIIKTWGIDEAQLFLWLSPAVMMPVLMVLWRGCRDKRCEGYSEKSS